MDVCDRIILPAVTLFWSVLWLIRKKKSGFHKFIFGLLICAILNDCIAASVPMLKLLLRYVFEATVGKSFHLAKVRLCDAFVDGQSNG